MDIEDPAVEVMFPVPKELTSSGGDSWGEDNHNAVWCEKLPLERPRIFTAALYKDIWIDSWRFCMS